MVETGDEIHVDGTAKALVVDVVTVIEHDEDGYGGRLMIRPL
jgi:hypothetical protein